MRKDMYNGKFIVAAMCLIMLLSACYYSDRKPGWEYMPDMAHSVTYETYSVNTFFSDSMSSRSSVARTIPRGGYMPFPYSAAISGYDSAGTMLSIPSGLTEADRAEGQRLYEIYCAVCHGKGGEGNGSIVENPKIVNPFPPPPSYFSEQLINLPAGKMYHSIHYGKNLMGSYTSALDEKQVWKIIDYVKSMQQAFLDKQTAAVADTTKSTP
jgi:mono/diheme cytochrome c family protein